MRISKAILYFVKYPEPGKVKTRLAQTLGTVEAARRYGDLAKENFNKISQLSAHGIDIIVVYDPPQRESQVKEWLPSAPGYLAQQGEDLGARLIQAMHSAFLRGYGRVMALGSDTLNLETALIQQGFDSLEDDDVVLGPAGDGGYYLIALSGEQPELFQDIAWSTSRVLEDTLGHIRNRKLTYALLAELEDLDKIEIKKS